jgi:16S rRNA (guanine966-N2)-methyltransferase
MTDRMKESVFSSLGDVEGLSVLDLYAGSGALGLEALSRGAKNAIFVESAREAMVKLRENVDTTGLSDRADIVWAEVSSVIGKDAHERVDLIFVDPPYSMPYTNVLADLEALVTGGWLSDEGRVVLHRPAKERRPQPFGLQITWERDYGQSSVYVFSHEDEDDA